MAEDRRRQPKINNRQLKNRCQVVRQLYLDSGLTYEEFSKVIDVKINTVKSWLSGRREPTEYSVKYVQMKIDEYLSNN